MAISGWTGALIAPSDRIHRAASLAVDHVGTQDQLAATTNPAHPEYAKITGMVLRDPTLGSRTTMASNVPRAGTPVGSASVFQFPGTGGSGIPQAVQAAIGNLNTNSQVSQLQQILNRVLGGQQGGGGAGTTAATEANNQAQADLAKARTAVIQAPQDIQGQLDALESKNKQVLGVMSLNPAAPGTFQRSGGPEANWQAQNLREQLARSKSAAGWTPSAW